MKIRRHETLRELDERDWRAIEAPDFPFGDYAFLAALESSGSVGADVGWLPMYFTLWDAKKLVGALPVYFKNNSYGEYIFDWAWARAYQENGLPYYPKLVAAVPFTPATGPKILVSPEAPADARRLLASAALSLAGESQVSSFHFLFTAPEERAALREAGLLERENIQYHWRNRGYGTFDDFLGDLKSRKRKAILQERRALAESGLAIEVRTGDGLDGNLAHVIYGFYLSTIEKMGAIPYLNLKFFETVFRTMPDRIVVALASDGDGYVAGTLNYRKGGALFGRYWGATRDVRFLHFELCYYRLIEYAIETGVSLFEAGAQGEHKIARGFLPERVFSSHQIAHPGFREAIEKFLERERGGVAEMLTSLKPELPFRQLGSES